MNNPYEAPKARVTDAPPAEAGPRPRSINVALVLIALFVVVECYHQVMRLADVNRGELSALGWLVDWIWVGVIVVVGYLIARGKGWARWVLVALMLWHLYQLANAWLFLSSFDPGMGSMFVDPVSLWMVPMSSLFSLGAVILVFGPGRGWFSRS